MKIAFIRPNIFLFTTFALGIAITSTFMYCVNFKLDFYSYLVKSYNRNLLTLINNFFIFGIGIVGSIWTYINYKRTNNIQFVFFYYFICSHTFEPLSILKYYFLNHELNLEFYYYMKIYNLITVFSLLNLFFLSLHICDFQIKSITYTIYLIFTFSIIYISLAPVNAYEHTNMNNSFLGIENHKFYVNLLLLLTSANFLVAFLRKKTSSYFLLFLSISLILIGIYLKLIEAPYSFIPISIGVSMYLKEAGKLFFYWL